MGIQTISLGLPTGGVKAELTVAGPDRSSDSFGWLIMGYGRDLAQSCHLAGQVAQLNQLHLRVETAGDDSSTGVTVGDDVASARFSSVLEEIALVPKTSLTL